MELHKHFKRTLSSLNPSISSDELQNIFNFTTNRALTLKKSTATSLLYTRKSIYDLNNSKKNLIFGWDSVLQNLNNCNSEYIKLNLFMNLNDFVIFYTDEEYLKCYGFIASSSIYQTLNLY